MTQVFKTMVNRALGILYLSQVGAGSNQADFPPGYTTSRTGDVHDFDYFAGGWNPTQRCVFSLKLGSPAAAVMALV